MENEALIKLAYTVRVLGRFATGKCQLIRRRKRRLRRYSKQPRMPDHSLLPKHMFIRPLAHGGNKFCEVFHLDDLLRIKYLDFLY